MGKRKKTAASRPPQRTRSTPIILGAVGLAMAVGIMTWLWLGREDPLGAVPGYTGGPRLAVDSETIDFGTVRFERMVTATFRLKNVGDSVLQLAANPPVEVVEGC